MDTTEEDGGGGLPSCSDAEVRFFLGFFARSFVGCGNKKGIVVVSEEVVKVR